MAHLVSRATIAIAAVIATTVLATPAFAQNTSSLPTSSSPVQMDWRVMNRTTFPSTAVAAVQQCRSNVALSDTDPLDGVKCDRLQEMLSAGQCRSVSVPDGIVLDILNGNRDGRRHAYRSARKALGRDDQALHCDAGGGVHFYWFTGENRSCNNLGVVFTTPPPVAVVPNPPPQRTQVTCRNVTTTQYRRPENPTYLPGFLNVDCCCGSTYVGALLLQTGDQGGYSQTITTTCGA